MTSTCGFFGLDTAVRPGFTAIRLDVAPQAGVRERYRELADAVDEHCPVLDLFRNPTAVERTGSPYPHTRVRSCDGGLHVDAGAQTCSSL